jgi:uncharacterized protein with NAD-binding domain and iron-sulfur cluster
VSRSGGRVAILGGGMAGLSAAWRLSEPGWRERFESITVYQRGWRLGGKGASSRGEHGRIEEHGLHIWLGSYENAFTMLRECYAELNRASTDPDAPIHSWDQAMIPADSLGMAEQWSDGWVVWPGHFSHNDQLPGEPGASGRELTVIEFLSRAMRLILDFADSLRETAPAGCYLSVSPAGTANYLIDTVKRGVLAISVAMASPPVETETGPEGMIGEALDAVREALEIERHPERRRLWMSLSLLTATVRGIIADKLITDPQGFRSINDDDYCAWILRHGAHPEVTDFPLVRGLYDMVFGFEGGDYRRPSFGAGLAVMLTGIALFQYKGAFFWKMTAGMGDVIIAPLYQALSMRGVRFEFFHRLDALHLDVRRQAIDTITIGRQARLAEGVDEYQPLERHRGLPVFPNAPLAQQIEPRAGLTQLESHFEDRDDVEQRTLRRGVDFDQVVLAVSLGMVELVAAEPIADRPEWREMITHVRTVATQAFQVWLQPEESTLGWNRPGVTTSGYVAPFDTWASMPQTLWAEEWPDGEHPGTVAYFCGAFDAEWPTSDSRESYVARCRRQVLDNAVDYLDQHVGLYLPGAVTERGFAWHLLSGAAGVDDRAALESQHISVNIDPSDRYVQSVPGSDKYRLRSDESGYDNMVLAGDWTDSGMNAGCIEAAVMSGLQAANALLGRGRFHRIRGFYMP